MVKSLLAGRAGLCLHELVVEGLGEVDLRVESSHLLLVLGQFVLIDAVHNLV